MILGGEAIRRAFKSGVWFGDNIDLNLVSSNSIDVRLDRTVKLAVSIGEGTTTPRWEEYHTPFNIRRGQFLLASIKERFVCTRELFLKDGYHCFAPMFEGRSTLARMGLQTHLSAGFGDYGFEGVFTLEI
jgi:deoxycytidine triphosphate deaminase